MQDSRVPCNCDAIDGLLGGGFEPGVVTQIYGASGTGKTNICIQLAVETVKRGFKVVYIDTEGFSAERFRQIAGERAEEVARDIIIFEPASFEEQHSTIQEAARILDSSSGRVGLVILDSAALFYRLQEGEGIELVRELAAQIGSLHRIARRHGIPVLITNQVYTDPETGELRPVGGNAIEHISKVILKLESVGDGKRRIYIKKHRSRPEGVFGEFQITGRGLEGISAGDRECVAVG